MMDFLRRLAPLRQSEPTRAVAMLPARFSEAHPLQAMPGQAPPGERIDDENTLSQPPENRDAARETDPAASPRPGPDSLRAPEHAPAPLDVGEANARRRMAIHPEKNADADPALKSAPMRPAVSRPARMGAPELAGLARPGRPAAHGAPPLSREILALRTPAAREADQVVHVTIGRIDVVATTGAVPPAPKVPNPRQPSVTLADYLRGSKEDRK